MRPTSQVLSKASRLPMKPFMGNKDFYKGNRAAYLPQGHRTGAPGKHIIGGKGNYRLIDEKVRIFIAPPIEEILNSKFRPYVHVGVRSARLRDTPVTFTDGEFTAERYAALAKAPAPAPEFSISSQASRGSDI